MAPAEIDVNGDIPPNYFDAGFGGFEEGGGTVSRLFVTLTGLSHVGVWPPFVPLSLMSISLVVIQTRPLLLWFRRRNRVTHLPQRPLAMIAVASFVSP